MAERRPWSLEERLLAFRLYCRLPFGRLHQRNPEIIALAQAIGRTPSAVAMKACNFASLDPHHQQRGVTGLGNASRADREFWQRFVESPTTVANEIEEAHESLLRRARADNQDLSLRFDSHDDSLTIEHLLTGVGETEREVLVRARRVQGFFRRSVLASYDEMCALSGLAVPSLLNASHIVPWSTDEERRADPRNGICLNALFDRAFDRGLITFDDSLRVVVSPALAKEDPPPIHREHLLGLQGRELRRPSRFEPDPGALAWHREHAFRASA